MYRIKVAALTILLIALVTVPTALTFAQTGNSVEENLVAMAKKAGDQVQTAITKIYADANSTQKIEAAGLMEQFENNITLYQTEGLTKLAQAQTALSNSEYSAVSDSALAALAVFRNVYGSLESIIASAGISTDSSILSNQTLYDAIERELQRLSTLQEILPTNTSEQVFALMDTANASLLEAKLLLNTGEIDAAQAKYLEAKQNISQIYQTLKTQAQESNTWRLNEYCQKLQQRIRERFAYGNQNGVDFNEALGAMGYQSENQFMQTLQSKIQAAQAQGNIQSAIAECESISQMVQQMEQSLNQEISRQQQGQNGTSDNGASGNGSANSGSNGPVDGGSGNSSNVAKGGNN